MTQPNTPKKNASKQSSGSSTPKLSGAQADLAGLHLSESVNQEELEREKEKYKEKAGLNLKTEELVAKVKKEEAESGKQSISLIVVGKSDAAGRRELIGQDMWMRGNPR